MPEEITNNKLSNTLFDNPTINEANEQKPTKQRKVKTKIINTQNTQTKTYLQISKNNLIFFLSTGCFFQKIICKDFKYIFSSNDLFSVCESKILITNNFCNNFKEDLIVELSLDFIPTSNIKIREGLNLITPEEFIPVSRIKNIFFNTEESKDGFLNSLNENAPNYSDICKVDKNIFKDSFTLDNSDFESIKEKVKLDNINGTKSKISKYISLLGMLKLASISDYLSWPYKQSFTYPSNEFLSFLHFINRNVFDNLQFEYKKEYESTFRIFLNQNDKEINDLNDFVLNFVIEKIDANEKFNVELIADIDIKLQEYLKNSKNSEQDKKTIKLIMEDFNNWINETPGVTYDKLTAKEIFLKNWSFLLLLSLIKYSNKEKIREIFAPLKTLNRVGKNSAIFWKILSGIGRYFGYKNLINSIYLEQDDKIIGGQIGNNITLKYEELIYFERLLMESVYKYVLTGDIYSDNFTFITKDYDKDEIKPLDIKNETIIKTKDYIISDKSFKIHGLPVKNLVITDKLTYLKSLIKKYYPSEIKEREYYLSFVLIKYNLITFNLNKNYSFIKIDSLLEDIDNNKQKYIPFANFLEDSVKFDKQHGNIK